MDAIIGNVVDFGMKKFKSTLDFDENLETLERNVKLLSDKAVDVKTEVENQEQYGKKKRKREVESWFDEVTKIEEGLRALKEQVTRGKKNGGALEKMNGRVGELLEQTKHFGTLVHVMYESEECPMLVQPVWEEKSKQNLEVVWTWLQDENVSSIGIYGMGGVGKTTLAKHIHNHLVNDHRYQVRWVTVSQGFSVKGLQEDLAKFVNLDLSNEEDEHRRSAKLNREFQKMNKMVIIILDDVWDRLCLEKLGDPLGVEGYKLILTTRLHEVCRKMGCQKQLEVKTLSTDDAWELFRKGLGSETQLSPDIESVAKSMAERCDGLPLGLITLAGSMRGVTDIREWRNALNEFPEDMESDVFKVLKYSYDRLRDTTMQECFLYCALYPEDYKIGRDELIGRFIMEGLVKGSSREDEFNHGHTILNKLVKLCLLEATDDWGVEAVRMHDLLREMALRITNDKPRYLVRAGIGSLVLEEQDWVFDLDRASFYDSNIKRIPEDMAPNCPTLSTLILSYCGLTMIPGSFFQYMNNLQVLDLSYNSELMDLPSCISNLESLRALSLRGFEQVKSVPSLGKLKNLRVLDVSGTGI
ncbi:probable disease resistance protein At4g14610, partial [Capsicum annuum]|uniref:probable disease resistance protein At4g14610 n=1 Tax=Capsicum annuum TaxID=4072 RepID=UPI001FB17A0C